jgi:hypothetical protein
VAKLDIYVSDELKRRLEAAKLPWGALSQACQPAIGALVNAGPPAAANGHVAAAAAADPADQHQAEEQLEQLALVVQLVTMHRADHEQLLVRLADQQRQHRPPTSSCGCGSVHWRRLSRSRCACRW